MRVQKDRVARVSHLIRRRAAPVVFGIAPPLLLGTPHLSLASAQFTHEFAPQEGAVASVEIPYRAEMSLNGSWKFQPEPLPAGFKQDEIPAPELPSPSAGGWDATPIKIPSPWNVNAFNVGDGGDFRAYPSYPNAWDSAQMGWLRKDFTVPAAWKGRRIFLRFDAIAGQSTVQVNGHTVGENFDLFLPAQYDVTDQITFGGTNRILVGVRKASLFNVRGITGSRPYPGGSMWGQAIAGIWQDVSLIGVAPVHVADTYIQPQVSKDILSDQITLRNDGPDAATVTVAGMVSPWSHDGGSSVLEAPVPKWHLGKSVLTLSPQSITVPAGKTATIDLSAQVHAALKPWTPDTPNLYGAVITVLQDGKVVDRKYTRFGWREFTFAGNKQLLNGKPLELKGDSWHFMGIPQMTRRYAWAWFKALKDAHGNAVRLHAQPYPAFYLDVADEMGVCVLDETAIWGSDAGHKYDSADFWTRADDQVRRLVLRDRNHASVFGWSVSNEVAWYIDGKQPALMDRLKQGWRDWLDTARTLDPSRPWVSTDGDNDARGIMPTSVSHYAGPKDIVRADKPFGEGETGGAYFATPKYAAQFNGSRAYESQQGRMEGIAIEAYGQIKEQREVGASYASVFNLVWYGLEPLALGQSDTSRSYTAQDGIFFPKYVEGKPGVQPERLGPYCSTLNPGYDPSLPLYKPWPLFDAIKAANAPGKAGHSPWDHVVKTPVGPAAPAPKRIASVVVLASDASLLPNELSAFGVKVADAAALTSADFVIVDGANVPADPDGALAKRLAERVQQGAVCLVLGPTSASIASLNRLLPYAIRLTERPASSLIVKSPDPMTAGMDNGDFYFTESVTGSVSRYVLEAPAAHSAVVLAACPTDWRKWNNAPEAMKTAATVRSERERGPAGAAMISMPSGSGRFVVTTLDLSSPSMEVLKVISRMLANSGVEMKEPQTNAANAFDMVGHLTQALACGRFGGASVDELYATDHIGIDASLKPVTGAKSGGKTWAVLKAEPNGVFDLKKTGDGPTDNAATYLSFWLWSPRPLDNLLVEPNMPKLDLLMGSDDGCQVWLNSKLIKEDRGVHPVTPDSIVAEALPLQRGWNHVVVKVVQGGGEWGYTARLRCTDARFLLGLKSSAETPSQ